MENKPGPHAIEGHSQAHKEAFDALVERISRTAAQEEQKRKQVATRTHIGYPKLGSWNR